MIRSISFRSKLTQIALPHQVCYCSSVHAPQLCRGAKAAQLECVPASCLTWLGSLAAAPQIGHFTDLERIASYAAKKSSRPSRVANLRNNRHHALALLAYVPIPACYQIQCSSSGSLQLTIRRPPSGFNI
jgi:hypothetical protein